MLFETELCSRVFVPVEHINVSGQVPKSLVMMCLLYQLSMVKATEKIGYFLAVTKVISIEKHGGGAAAATQRVSCKCSSTSRLVFRVKFCCRIFMPKKGEILIGVVYRVLKTGVFLKCGPMKLVYLASPCMPMYQYVKGEEEEDPYYVNHNDMSRIQKDAVIRFTILAFRWNNVDSTRRGFEILATIAGHSLGPISSAGSEAMDF